MSEQLQITPEASRIIAEVQPYYRFFVTSVRDKDIYLGKRRGQEGTLHEDYRVRMIMNFLEFSSQIATDLPAYILIPSKSPSSDSSPPQSRYFIFEQNKIYTVSEDTNLYQDKSIDFSTENKSALSDPFDKENGLTRKEVRMLTAGLHTHISNRENKAKLSEFQIRMLGLDDEFATDEEKARVSQGKILMARTLKLQEVLARNFSLANYPNEIDAGDCLDERGEETGTLLVYNINRKALQRTTPSKPVTIFGRPIGPKTRQKRYPAPISDWVEAAETIGETLIRVMPESDLEIIRKVTVT